MHDFFQLTFTADYHKPIVANGTPVTTSEVFKVALTDELVSFIASHSTAEEFMQEMRKWYSKEQCGVGSEVLMCHTNFNFDQEEKGRIFFSNLFNQLIPDIQYIQSGSQDMPTVKKNPSLDDLFYNFKKDFSTLWFQGKQIDFLKKSAKTLTLEANNQVEYKASNKELVFVDTLQSILIQCFRRWNSYTGYVKFRTNSRVPYRCEKPSIFEQWLITININESLHSIGIIILLLRVIKGASQENIPIPNSQYSTHIEVWIPFTKKIYAYSLLLADFISYTEQVTGYTLRPLEKTHIAKIVNEFQTFNLDDEKHRQAPDVLKCIQAPVPNVSNVLQYAKEQKLFDTMHSSNDCEVEIKKDNNAEIADKIKSIVDQFSHFYAMSKVRSFFTLVHSFPFSELLDLRSKNQYVDALEMILAHAKKFDRRDGGGRTRALLATLLRQQGIAARNPKNEEEIIVNITHFAGMTIDSFVTKLPNQNGYQQLVDLETVKPSEESMSANTL